MFGTAGGIAGPWLVGVLVGSTGNFSLAVAVLASLLIVAPLAVSFDRSGRGRPLSASAR
jgi:MFS-type transporter involved in bile tolerance (Atg22 family)